MLRLLRLSLVAVSLICPIFVSGGAIVLLRCLMKFVPRPATNGSGLFLLVMRSIGSVGVCAVWKGNILFLMTLFLMKIFRVALVSLVPCRLLHLRFFLFLLASNVLSLEFVRWLGRRMMRLLSLSICGGWPGMGVRMGVRVVV